MKRTRGYLWMLLCSLSSIAAATLVNDAYACVGGAQEAIDVTWQDFATAAAGSETIGGMTITSDGNSTFTADDVASVANGGFNPDLSITATPTDWTVSAGAGTNDSTFTGIAFGPMTPSDASSSGSGASPTFTVSVVGVTQTCSFNVSAPAQSAKGQSVSITVTAVDINGITTPGYTGTVAFALSSLFFGQSPLPNSMLTNGVGTFTLTLNSAGSNTFTATDTVDNSVTGSATIQVTDFSHTSLNASPGATLLFPYFEVDPTSPTGRDTLLSLQNASATAILGHVTVWTDLGYPVLTFNIYLTGYDVESIDMYDMFVNGNLPETASAGQDPSDRISPKGDFSQDINFASCNGQLPYQSVALLQTFRNDLQAALTGHAATFLHNQCSAFNHDDTIMRGYVTIDTVNNCTQRMPTDIGYFGNGGNGDATNQNVMAGEYFLVDAGSHLMQSDTAVAVHADASNGDFSTAGKYTFYGRIDPNTPWSAVDNRQPLPNTWAVDAQAAGTELIVWRDIKIPPTLFSCSQPLPQSAGLPLGQETAFSFDNQASPLAIPAGTPFGLATQRVALGSAAFPLPVKPGWVYLGLGYNNATLSGANAPADTAADQAFVSVLQYPESHATSTGTGAIALDSGQAALHSHPNP
jgi:hypothetical protein